MGINMADILEYVNFVDPILPVIEVPKIPIPKESHFNFLKPGSKEVLTRPVHIHEHLPPINPPEDETLYSNGEKDIDVVGFGMSGDDIFKRPADSSAESSTAKKIKLEEEGRATREISSVMMTTSGFISPAREGRLPEARPPKLADEFPKPIPPPLISPPFKSKEIAGPSNVNDKKLEKKLKKKEKQEKERKKDKHVKDRFLLPDPSELEQFNPPPIAAPQIIMPREANEDMLMAERKKELKKLKTKVKDDNKKKKEKPPKVPKQSQQQNFDSSFLDVKPKFDPFNVLPTSLPQPPSTSSQIQAHNYLTGAAHTGLYTNPLIDQNIFSAAAQSQSLLSQNPIIDGKLISEPDKNKLNIFKKIQRQPKEDLLKQQLPDFISPSKFDQIHPSTATSSSSSSQQIFTDPSMKKIPKLPKETTLTRIDDNMPMNLSGMSNARDYEEPLPKTPTIPRTPEIVHNFEKKEKKERKKREKKIDQQQQQQHQQTQLDWAQQQQQYSNPFDLSSPQNNPFLQTLQNNLLNNPFMNAGRNPFSSAADIFPSGPGLIPRAAQFGMSAAAAAMVNNPYGFAMPNMDMNLVQTPPKKVKAPKPTPQSVASDFLQMGSKLCNVASLMPPSINLMNVVEPSNPSHFPLQQTFDQLMKDQTPPAQLPSTPTITPAKKFIEEKVETFDLTKDSSPEPLMTAPTPSAAIAPIVSVLPPQQLQEILPVAQTSTFQQEIPMDIEQPVIKEKSKEKKKKKDKDKERDKDKEERKKVICALFFIILLKFN